MTGTRGARWRDAADVLALVLLPLPLLAAARAGLLANAGAFAGGGPGSSPTAPATCPRTAGTDASTPS
ncbi:hypothetical protein AB0G37_27690, partial [Streptomyces fradiae]